MLISNNQQSDAALIALFARNNTSALEQLYDKYAPMMYGTILNITGDEKIADEILEKAFLELNSREILLQMHTTLCHSLLKHTYKSTLKHLKVRGLTPTNCPLNGQYPLLHLFYFEEATLRDVVLKLGITEQEALKSLHAEFNHLCNQK
jgi:DNA-directed RNA polymerase specialized sigma24 family protein